MTVVTWEALRVAEHFIMRHARLIDRHRFAFHFQSGLTSPVRSALDAYRNVDQGYGNGLHPDLRGHGSQPLATQTALRYLDELGTLPADTIDETCRYLTSVTHDNGGLPPVLPNVRYTESAPWWRAYDDPAGTLTATAAITGLLHKHRITHPWRDRATAFCWGQICALNWTRPSEAIALCTFLQHAPEQDRAHSELHRLAVQIRSVFETDPAPHTRARKPLDLATHPGHIARPLFTDDEIEKNLDTLEAQQRPDGGWNTGRPDWNEHATHEWQGILTIHRLRTLRAYGRFSGYVPQPRRDSG